MAAFGSVATVAWATAGTCVVPKPSGLAVGDLMVAHIAATNGATVSTPSGWTLVRSDTNASGDPRSYVFRKFADAADVAASSFTFTLSGSQPNAGAIWRITDAPKGAPIYASNGDGDDNATNPTFTNTVTPLTASALLLFLVAVQQANSNSAISGYAVTTSNPSWTEAYDFDDNGSTDAARVLAGAYATRPETTATGNSTVAISNSSNPDSVGQMVVIITSKDITVADTVTIVEAVKLNLSILAQDVIAIAEVATVSMTRAWRNNILKIVSDWRNNWDKS